MLCFGRESNFKQSMVFNQHTGLGDKLFYSVAALSQQIVSCRCLWVLQVPADSSIFLESYPLLTHIESCNPSDWGAVLHHGMWATVVCGLHYISRWSLF